MEYIIKINDNDETDSDGGKRVEEMHRLVRCKDCKFLKPLGLLAKQCCPLLNIAVSDDWYCAYGERKDGDGE